MSTTTERTKLKRLPANYKVEKRPLHRPPIASKYAGSSTQKVVYISSKTPYMAAVKRVQKLLSQVEKRATQSVAATERASRRGKNKNVRKSGARDALASHNVETGQDEILKVATALAADSLRGTDGSINVSDEVILQGTGKAIQKTLSIALWFQSRDEYRIAIKTGSIGAIDDLVPPADDTRDDVQDSSADVMDVDVSHAETKEDDEIPAARIRQVSHVQVHVALR